MRLTLHNNGWHGPSVQQHGVFDYLVFGVEDATADKLQMRVDHEVFGRVNPAEPLPKRESFTERLTLLGLGRVAALGPERISELLSDETRHPTLAINIDERDAEDLRRLPGAKVCRYQSTEAGDLHCLVGKSPVSKQRPMQTTRHMCGGCSLPDSRVACVHLQHAVVGFIPGEMPSVLQAQCDIGRFEVGQDASRCRPGGHACWAKDVEFSTSEQARLQQGEALTQAAGRIKDQKFGILDAQRHQEGDLTAALGVQGVGLIYLDIDRFKQVNSKYTERVVDRTVLPQFQRLVADTTRGHGYAYAEGGDEVVILLPNSSPAMAIAFVSDLLAMVRATTFVVGEAKERLTISAGLAIARSPDDAALLADRANLAKNYSKDHGRDRASLWTPAGCRPCPVAAPWPTEPGTGEKSTGEQAKPSYGTLDQMFEDREKGRR